MVDEVIVNNDILADLIASKGTLVRLLVELVDESKEDAKVEEPKLEDDKDAQLLINENADEANSQPENKVEEVKKKDTEVDINQDNANDQEDEKLLEYALARIDETEV